MRLGLANSPIETALEISAESLAAANAGVVEASTSTGRRPHARNFRMRYHKAILITKAEADFLLDQPTPSLSDCVVIESFGKWYDVRNMNARELNAFVDDLQRSNIDDLTASVLTLH